MKNDEFTMTFDIARGLWGEPAQWLMVIEECNELAATVAKHIRGRDVGYNLLDELADVEIMLMQARLMVDSKKLDTAVKLKFKRFNARVSNELKKRKNQEQPPESEANNGITS